MCGENVKDEGGLNASARAEAAASYVEACQGAPNFACPADAGLFVCVCLYVRVCLCACACVCVCARNSCFELCTSGMCRRMLANLYVVFDQNVKVNILRHAAKSGTVI